MILQTEDLIIQSSESLAVQCSVCAYLHFQAHYNKLDEILFVQSNITFTNLPHGTLQSVQHAAFLPP